jgi:hypothetical protein
LNEVIKKEVPDRGTYVSRAVANVWFEYACGKEVTEDIICPRCDRFKDKDALLCSSCLVEVGDVEEEVMQ